MRLFFDQLQCELFIFLVYLPKYGNCSVMI